MDYYVKTGGGTGAGTSDGTAWSFAHFKTRTFAPGDRIFFRRGDTFDGNFTIASAGTSSARITYGAYGSGANPIISCFATATGFTSVGTNLWESSALSGTYAAKVVTINNTHARVGRWPNYNPTDGGYRKIATVDTVNRVITDTSLTNTPNWTGGTIVFRTESWAVETATINTHSTTSITYTPIDGMNYVPKVGWGYFIQNHISTLDTQDEWYFNTATRKLTVYSTTSPTNVKIAAHQYGIYGSSKPYVTIENIDVEGTWEAGIYLSNCQYTTIQNCRIQFNYDGVRISGSTGNNCTVQNCQVWDTHDFGIHCTTTASVIQENNIQRSGLFPGMFSGNGGKAAIVNNNINTVTRNNHMEELGYLGIRLDQPTLIEGNVFKNTTRNRDDGGGIYSQNLSFANQPAGITIKNNIFFNDGSHYGAHGTNRTQNVASAIYADDGENNWTIEGNTVTGYNYAAIFLHSVWNMKIYNNILYDNAAGIRIQQDEPVGVDNVITGNVIVAKEPFQLAYDITIKDNTIATFGTFDNNVLTCPNYEGEGIILYRGGSFSSGQQLYLSLAGWQSRYGKDLASTGRPHAVVPYTLGALGTQRISNGTLTTANATIGSHTKTVASWQNTDPDFTGGYMNLEVQSGNGALMSIGAGTLAAGASYLVRVRAKSVDAVARGAGFGLRTTVNGVTAVTPVQWVHYDGTARNIETVIRPSAALVPSSVSGTLMMYHREWHSYRIDNLEVWDAPNIVHNNNIIFEVNETSVPVTRAVDSYSTAFKGGTAYTTSIVIPARSSVLSLKTTTPADTTPPVPGNSGALAVGSITQTTATASWTAATDASAITYYIYRNTAGGMNTVANTKINGTLVGNTTSASFGLTGMLALTTYYVTVIARDAAGNEAVYTQQQFTTLAPDDTTAPVVGNSGTISITNVTTTGFRVNWTKATDNLTPQSALVYSIYTSPTNNITGVTNAETNGVLLVEPVVDNNTQLISELLPSTLYFITIVVRDEKNNKSAYGVASVTTGASTGKVVKGRNIRKIN